MKKIILALLFTVFLHSGDIINIKSNNSVKATMDKIEKGLRDQGFYIFNRVNHPQHIRQNTKYDIDEETETILFDKPSGTKHMYTYNSSVMLEVPFKIAVYKNIDDEVFISYKSIDAIIKEHEMQECKFLQEGLRKALKKITKMASIK